MSYKQISPIPVTNGGTGVVSTTTAYAPICAGTTDTGPLQTAGTGISTSGFVLTSNGASALPSFQAVSAVTPDIAFIAGTTGLIYGDPVTFTGGTSGAVFTGSGATMTRSFNYLSLPFTTAVNGQILINSVPFMHGVTSGVSTSAFIGSSAGIIPNANSNTVGIGYNSLRSLTTFDGSVAIGKSALNAFSSNTNVGIGYQVAMSITSTCANNVIIGPSACTNAGTGFQTNVVIGSGAMTGATKSGASINNVSIGSSTGTGITTGAKNIFLGDSAGQGVSTGGSNVNIQGGNVGNTSNQLTIGSGAGTGTQQLNKAFIHGIRGITTANADAIAVLVDSAGQLGTTSSSIRYKENIESMGDISNSLLNLRPVIFDFIGKPSYKKQVGLIAEEVNQIIPSLVVHNIDGEIESVKYQELSILLLNEIKKALKRVEFLENKLQKQF